MLRSVFSFFLLRTFPLVRYLLCLWGEVGLFHENGNNKEQSLWLKQLKRNLKILTPWKKSCDKQRHHIKKQRHHFANNSLYRQSHGFSSGHEQMWDLDHKEDWAPKNWCFWNMVLEKTLDKAQSFWCEWTDTYLPTEGFPKSFSFMTFGGYRLGLLSPSEGWCSKAWRAGSPCSVTSSWVWTAAHLYQTGRTRAH